MRRILASILSLVMLFSTIGVAASGDAAVTYYVSATGNDENAGTADAPFATIQAAINAAADGDIIIVKEGNYNAWCPNTADNNITGTERPGHNIFINKNVTIKGEGEVNVYSLQDDLNGAFDTKITVLISGTDGVVIDNLNVFPCYYPATIESNLPTVTESKINEITGNEELKVYYNQIFDTMRNYNGSASVSENYIANVTIQNCTIGDPGLAEDEWGSAIYFPGYVNNGKTGLTGGYKIKNNVLYGGVCLCEGAAEDATSEECIIADNDFYDALILNGARPTGWNYKSLTVFPTVTGNTFYKAMGKTNDIPWYIGSRDGVQSKLLPKATLLDYIKNNTLSVDGNAGKAAIGSYAYSDSATEYYALATYGEAVASIDDVKYASLQDAVDAAESEDKITLLGDTSANGVKVASGKNFTLDLGGHTYTVVAPTVGSEGTKTSGFQLLKDSTITITNGTITSSEAKFLIQNYSNLTLDGVTLDGSNLVDPTNMGNYTLSNNCGNITIKDSTIIADTDGEYPDFAFDVCDYASYSGVKVTVTGNSAINGAFEVTDPNEGVNKPELIINGGKFTQDPSAYIAKGYKVINSTDEDYKYEVAEINNESVESTDVETTIVIVTPEATVEVPDDATEEVIAVAEAISNPEIQGTANTVGGIAESVKVDDAVEALTDKSVSIGEEDTVHIFIQPMVNVKVAEASIGEVAADNTITFDITLTANVIASTAETLEDVKLDGEGKNAVSCGTETMEIGDSVEISIPITEELANKLPATIMVKHIKDSTVYYYEATIVNNAIVFTNPHGFSKFEISKADNQEITIKFDSKDKKGKAIADIEDITIYDIGVKEIEFTDAYKSGYRFDGWTFGDDDKEYEGKVTLTEELWATLSAAAEDGVVKASPSYIQEEDRKQSSSNISGVYATYKIQFNSTGGTAVADAIVAKGGNLTEPQAPTKGEFVFAGWYTDKSYSVAYDFSKPVYASFTLYAKWESADGTTVIFEDVTENDWFFDVVNEAYEKGLMNGMGDGAFAPNAEVTRGMFVTVLYRIASEPEILGAAAFEDVAADKYYANAIAWASENGIVNGMSETEFMPERSISREQMATILYRYAEVNGEDVSIGGTLSFSDAESISEYAVAAIEWACAEGLMNGYPEGTYQPQNTATRAEAAAVLVRMTK